MNRPTVSSGGELTPHIHSRETFGKRDPGSAHWRFFGVPYLRSEARRRKVEKCPARGGIPLSKSRKGLAARGPAPVGWFGGNPP
jgi:hypothetical protein